MKVFVVWCPIHGGCQCPDPMEALDDEALAPHQLRAEAEAERDRALAVLRELVDTDPCRFDHDGYCQTHLGETDNGTCPMADARSLLGLE